MSNIDIARRVIKEEEKALANLAADIPVDFDKLIDTIIALDGGRVILIGMGKSGYIAKKIAASLASTGTPSFFIHPGEASHGDLGMITENDLAIMLSNSGETKELFDAVNYCKRYGIKIAGMTMKTDSTLAKNSDFLLNIPENSEVSSISAPTSSALMMLALGDALVTALHEIKGFSSDDFYRFHPGGKIGTNLLKVNDLMYTNQQLPLVNINDKFNEIIVIMTKKSLGCAIVINKEKNILGIITDGDLRRHINDDNLHTKTANQIMTESPIVIQKDLLATEALNIMNKQSITAVPVVTREGKITGIIHLHSILRVGVG